jgi:hypothetical protein
VPFENWGSTVHNTPKFTFLPNTVKGVQNIVRFALSKNYRVRCAGYRHSWSSIFSQDNEVLISFVNLKTVTTLPDPMALIPGKYNPATAPELKTIELKEETVPGKKRLCRVGAAVTNEEFRRWAIAGKAWTLPADVILVEVSADMINPYLRPALRRIIYLGRGGHLIGPISDALTHFTLTYLYSPTAKRL